MNTETTTSPSIRRTLRYVEWTILAMTFVVVKLNSDPWVGYSPIPDYAFFTLLGVIALLSLIFPINRPLWQRRVYVFLEMLLIIPTRITDWDLGIILYFFLGKSCFLLPRKDVIITSITVGIAWILTNLWSMPGKIDFIISNNSQLLKQLYDTNRFITSVVINDIGVYIACSTFVVLFSLVAIAEQKSRKKAVALAKQVESLAATLERNRIARDIHDSLGHTLTTLDIQLELAQRLHQRHPDKALQALNTAKELSSQSLTEVRRALQTMREENFDLNKALVTLVDLVKQNQSFDIQQQVNLPPLPLQTSHQLYCIVQEGLTNIQKYAVASRVSLRGQSTAEGIVLDLEDDGIGFDPDLPHTGFGLRGMQERVKILGGQLKLNSTPGQGTHIQVIIPR